MLNAISVIVANLAHLILYPPAEGEAVSLILPTGHGRAAAVEKREPGFGEPLPALLAGLAEVGVLSVRRPTEHRHATTIAPTAAFRLRLVAFGVSGGDIGRRIDPQRLLRLSQRLKDWRTEERIFFPVPDTPETAQLREQMRLINEGLASARLAYLGNDPVDVGDRLLVRRFNLPTSVETPCVFYGGRLWGGFWQNMGREKRQHIRINGEPAVELDYGQMFPRLAYGLVSERPEPGFDLYAIPGLEGHRDGVKQGVNALIWGVRRNWPSEIAKELPQGWTVNALRSAFLARHPKLSPLFDQGDLLGYRLLFLESAITVAVLIACLACDIAALPIHDAVLVPTSAAVTVSEIMTDTALRLAGSPIPVTMKE